MNDKKILATCLLAVFVIGCILTAGCISASDSHSDASVNMTCGLSEDEEYHDVLLDTSSDEFDDAGFVLGDSLDLYFSNGESILDVPYVSGYILPKGTVAVVCYNGKLYLNHVDVNGLWDSLGLDAGDTVKIELAETQKYSTEQEANSYKISVNRSDFGSDEEFANFRPLNYGNLKSNYFYRGASPIDNAENRASTVDSLLKKYGIQTILSLSGTDETVRAHQQAEGHDSPVFDALYANGSVIMCGISTDVSSEETKQAVSSGLRALLSHEGPYYIHCLEGKDRSGYLSILLGALGNATDEEILQDYFKTYENYFHITQEEKPGVYAQFKKAKLDPVLDVLTKNGTLSLHDGSVAYLKEGGMSDVEISELFSRITA